MSSRNRSGRLSRAIQLTLGIATGALAPYFAYAQTAPEAGNETLDEVVVSGFRASLETALLEKRESAASIDSIKAEDIAKFPDSNLAESLQRIPGVSIARDAGEGRNLTVRGLGPAFTRVRVNGMEAMSSTGGTDSSGGANRNRQFDFNVFASELFNSITARKTASADVEEGSLGATVDLQTARPFDYSGFTAVASVKGAYNDLSEDIDPRAAFLISNTWADGKFGALFSAAYAKRNLVEEGNGTVRWDAGTSSGNFAAAGSDPQARLATTFHPRLPRYGTLTHEQERLGLTGALQWQINDANLVNLDVLYSQFDATRTEDWLEAISFSRTNAQGGKPQTTVISSIVEPNGTMVYGLFNGVDIRSERRYDELETKFTTYTLTGSHQISDRWSLSELIGYSQSKFDNPIQTTITLDRRNTNGYSFDYRGNDRHPAFNYGFDVTDPASWVFDSTTAPQSEIRLRPQGVDNKFVTGQVDLKFDFSDSIAFKGGINYKKYNFDSTESRRASETTVPTLPAGVTLASLSEIHSSQNLGAPPGTPTAWLAPNINAFANALGIYSNTGTFALTSLTNNSARGNNRGVEEKDTGVYVQMNFSTDWGVPIRGDIGVRYVKTDMDSYGYLPVPNVATIAYGANDYSDVLPALNVVAEVTDDMLVRFGAAKVMTRPALGSVSPGVAVNLTGNLSITAGDPNLDPIRATTYDLAWEWYFSRGSLISAAIFYKDIDSFVQTLSTPVVFNDTGLPLGILSGTSLTGTEVFQYNQPVNTDGGPLAGFEINYQQSFHFLPGWLSNFGMLLNYTYVDSTIDYRLSTTSTTTIENDLVGLSNDAYNATLYYENETFSIRASAAYRDRYLTNVPAANAPTIQDAEGTNETLNVDLSASWNVTDQLTLSIEGLNLSDEYNDQFIDTRTNRVVVYSHTGRQLFVGGRYKF
jgi:iron complex outermembrane receptor protein